MKKLALGMVLMSVVLFAALPPQHQNIKDLDTLVAFVKQHPKYGDLAIEIETLYGTGLPLLKLRKTIESRISKGLKLWIIIPNPQLILFLKDIAKLGNIYRKKYPEHIKIFTLDIYSLKLIPLQEIIKKINTI